ncbi:MAG TPA: hypothetical protein VJ455_07175 [Ignavibacteria bacterium]|nr:hypothetical protein [Ignavibacteria bacterium]
MIKIISSIILALAVVSVYAQNNSGTGWNIYTSMKDVRSVSIIGNDVWAASTGGLFRFDAAGLSGIKKFTSIDGLLSNELSSGIADLEGNIWAGAQDGSISLYNPSNGTWRVISDIRSSGESNRRINHFFQYGNLMFFATEFCIVKFSISQFQFVDQPYIFYIQSNIKAPAKWIHVVNDTIWAATSYGIAYANVNSSLPIGSSWKNFTINNSVLNRNLINTIAYFNNKVFFGTDSGMVYFQNGTLLKYEPLFNGVPVMDAVKSMSAAGNSLYFSSYRNSQRIYKVNANDINTAVEVYSGVVNNFKANSAGELFVGTEFKGVDVFRNNTHNYVSPNGQFSNLAYNISIDQNSNVWVVSGGLGDWSTRSGIYRFDGSSWFNFTYADYPVMGNGCCGWINSYSDRFGNLWVSGFGNGLLKIHGNEVERFNDANSILQSFSSAGFVLVQGADEDNSGDLWVINNRVQNNFINFTKQEGYPAPAGNPFDCHFIALVVDNYNTKWAPLHQTEGSFRGLMYFNEGISPRGALIPYGNLGANVSQLNDIVVDNNGEVWVATNNGITIIPDPSQVVNNPGTVPYNYKMSIIENGFSTPLTENVTSIDVDALNNKWIGTISNGLLYVSPDGTNLMQKFNISNSPLLDNNINTIRSDKKSGIVYFGSDKGIVSYRTIAITPLAECDKITVGPNPFVVPGNYPLRIDGLVEESTVKILTISGTLVAEFETAGGRVTTWDGRDTYGNYVSSGIYIIAGFNKDGSKVCKGKVAVVRK